MERNPFFRSLTLLNQSGVPYVVVGGFAVVMHGVNRFTPDLNIIISFEESGVESLFQTFESHDLVCLDATVRQQFRSSIERTRLLPDQNRRFLSFYDQQAPPFQVDFFTEHPYPFDELFAAREQIELEGETLSLCSLPYLIQLKQLAARGQDLADIDQLRVIEALRSGVCDLVSLQAQFTDFSREHLASLKEFHSLKPADKMSWLLQMLTQLGQFCVL